MNGRRRILCSVLGFFTLPVTSVLADDSSLTAILSSSPVSLGGTAQIALTLPVPLALVAGGLSIDLDPAVFDSISAINVFSASGDQVGTANIQGLHADVQFTSDSGGIGRLPTYPVLELTAPVLVTAKTGTTDAVEVQSKLPWRDLRGDKHVMSFRTLPIRIGVGMSIQSVVPGGGPVPAGTQVQINGEGFTASTKLQLEGVAWSNLRFINPRQLSLTLSGPADLTGKLIILTDANGTQSRYYSALTPTYIRLAASVPASVQPIFSRITYSNARVGYQPFALANASVSPVEVTFQNDPVPIGRNPPPAPNTTKITLPAGAVYVLDSQDMPVGNSGPLMISSLPVRMVALCCTYTAELTASAPTASSSQAYFSVYPNNGPITFEWRPGDPPPSPMVLTVLHSGSTFVINAGIEDDGDWISASLSENGDQMTVTVNPAGLGFGSHRGLLTIFPPGATAPSDQVDVILNVHPFTAIASTLNQVSLAWNSVGTLTVTSTGAAVPITVSTPDGWLSVSPASATTPADLIVSVTDPPLVAGQAGGKWSTITVQGPGNSLQIPVYVGFDLGGNVYPTQVTLSSEAGTDAVVTRRIDIGPTLQPITFESATESGGAWLSTIMTTGPGQPGLAVSVTASGLAPGTYRGTVTLHPMGIGFRPDPITVSINFTVWSKPVLVPKVSPSSVDFTAPAKTRGLQLLSLSTGSLPLEFTVECETDDGPNNWLGADGPPVDFGAPRYTPTGIMIQTYVSVPGVYHGRLIVTAPPGSANSVIVPVTLTATPAPALLLTSAPPLIASMVNGASLLVGPISPGEIVTLFGTFGPNATSGVNIGQNGTVTSSSYGNRVLFNGVPAPITYMSASQVNAVVPYEIAGSSNVNVELDMAGIHSPAWTVAVVPSAPGLFTQSGAGQGSAAVLNQDNSLNTPANPAARGSIVQIFATGEGQTNPPGSTGEITELNVRVFGGICG